MGDINITNANITLRANDVLLDSGTYISVGTKLETVNPLIGKAVCRTPYYKYCTLLRF